MAVPATTAALPNEETRAALDQMIGHYKRSKFLAELEAIKAASAGVPVVIVNPTAPVGPGDWKPTPTGRIIVDFLNGKMPAYVDTGLNVVPVEDVAAGHLLAAEKGRIGERYILGARNMTLKQILDALAQITGRPAPRVKMPHAVALAAGYADQWISRLTGREPQIPVEGVKMSRHRMFVESDKAERELGYKPGFRRSGARARGALVRRAWLRSRPRRQQAGPARSGSMSVGMKILVTFALENEFAPWRAMHDFRSGKWGAAEAHFAEIGGADVGVVLTGAGPKQAALTASAVMRSESDSISLCISSGLAGGLKDAYEIGHVLAAKSVFSEAPHADLPSHVLDSSPALVAFAGECGATIVDQFYSAPHVVGRSEEKRHLGKVADAVEMESFEIMHEAAAFGIPAVAIRAISDLAGEDLPLDMDGVFNEEGRVSIPRVLGQVALHPGSLPDLMKLGNQSKRAAESLAQFLDRYVPMLVDRAKTLETNAATAGQ